ncbi:coiled-coil domain-containing protein 90B, mitochondrial isoform X3 [Passer montanus]|nr:coiled-coil domain-containing protein 90B, mitochondrial isoform X3 [Passer montanus]
MVTQAQQEITLQQIMAHLDSIRKDMVILEKSEFANLRAENEKMKIELDQVKQQLMTETGKIRADSKLDINLERSRVTDMFTDQERKLMEATTEFHKKDANTNSIISEISNKIDTEIASLKTLMESNKLDTIRYLAASVHLPSNSTGVLQVLEIDLHGMTALNTDRKGHPSNTTWTITLAPFGFDILTV